MYNMIVLKKHLIAMCISLIGALCFLYSATAQSDTTNTSVRIFLPYISSQSNSVPERSHSGFSGAVLSLQTGTHNYPDSDAQTEFVSFSQVLNGDSTADAMQLHFSNVNLGQNSFIRLTSLQDNGQQQLDTTSIRYWNNYSAVFNGNQVKLELIVGEGDTGIFANMDSYFWQGKNAALIDARRNSTTQPESSETLCGNDNRVASTDSRVARLNGNCTAWLVSNGAVLTAGHCTDFDPDDDGPLLPDGILDWTQSDVIEFNVPASDADGTLNWAAPNDQFPVDINRVDWRFDGEGQGLGKDWAVFAVLPNKSNQFAHARQGFFRMTNGNPAQNNDIRITGYGIDQTPVGTTGGRNAQTQTLQTEVGPYRGETTRGADIWLEYSTDTTAANSGSPIIWDATGFTVGIHTNGGCDNTADSANAGTSFEVDALEAAIDNFLGANALYVDTGGRASPGDGSIFRPYRALSNAIASAPNNATLSIVQGTYSGVTTLNKPLTLTAPVGPVELKP